jgi:spermidine synthase
MAVRDEGARVAVVGLGAGTLAAYGKPGQHFAFYEIDPTVVRLARDPRCFTFLGDCRATVEVVVGDARLTLAAAPPQSFDLIVLDAFSSDSIPLHLISREALRGYRQKLVLEGVLAFHISNRYLDLAPVLADLAADARLECWDFDDQCGSAFPSQEERASSHWLVMARREQALCDLIDSGNWSRPQGTGGRPPWSDDFSNVFLEICRTWSNRDK